MPIAKLFKINKLGPVGLIAAIACFVGIFLPWKIANISAAGKVIRIVANGTLEPVGWIMAILIILYILLLFAHFKWNILVSIVILMMSIYEWWFIRGEIANNNEASMSYGLYVIIISSLVMSLSKLLLFRKKKGTEAPPNSQPS